MGRSSFAELRSNAVDRQPGAHARRLGQLVRSLEALEADHDGAVGDARADEIRLRISQLIAAFRATTRCKRCGRELVDSLAVARGIGPDCWEKTEPARQVAIDEWLARREAAGEEPT